MSLPKISVIVPVYNAEKYLHRCIDSILAQTFTDFELLLIDDGSKDGSGKICDEYAARDVRVRVFHKPNGGVSSARNLGLDNATGEWIAFIDSDDWVDADYLEILCVCPEADLSIVSFKGEGYEGYNTDFPSGLFQTNDLGRLLLNYATYPQLNAPWSKLFRASIIQEQNLRFNVNLHTVEDTIFVLNYIANIDCIYSNQLNKYHYWVGGTGLSCNLTNNHNSYNAIIEEINQILTDVERRFSFNKTEVFHKLIEGRIFQELSYIQNIGLSNKQMIILKELLHNPFVKQYFASQTHSELYGIKWDILIFLCKHNLLHILLLYINFLNSINHKIL